MYGEYHAFGWGGMAVGRGEHERVGEASESPKRRGKSHGSAPF